MYLDALRAWTAEAMPYGGEFAEVVVRMPDGRLLWVDTVEVDSSGRVVVTPEREGPDRCCTSHVPGPAGACCDPDDCGPCCPACPTCPTEHARKAR